MTGNSEDVVSAFFRAMSEREVEVAEALLSSEAVFHVPATVGSTAEPGRAFVRDLTTAFPDLQIELRNSFAAGDKVVVELTMGGTQAEDHWGIAAQGKHVYIDQAWLVNVAGGLITGASAFWCQNVLYRRLGAPSPGPAPIQERVPTQ